MPLLWSHCFRLLFFPLSSSEKKLLVPFAGAGSELDVCRTTDRICVAIEKDTRRCAAIKQRSGLDYYTLEDAQNHAKALVCSFVSFAGR